MSATDKRPEPLPGPCLLTPEEVKQVQDALRAASADIWQTARVSEYNLTGKDPTFPEDASTGPPKFLQKIHRAGLDESYRVHAQVREALRMLSLKAAAPVEPPQHQPGRLRRALKWVGLQFMWVAYHRATIWDRMAYEHGLLAGMHCEHVKVSGVSMDQDVRFYPNRAPERRFMTYREFMEAHEA